MSVGFLLDCMKPLQSSLINSFQILKLMKLFHREHPVCCNHILFSHVQHTIFCDSRSYKGPGTRTERLASVSPRPPTCASCSAMDGAIHTPCLMPKRFFSTATGVCSNTPGPRSNGALPALLSAQPARASLSVTATGSASKLCF